MHENWHALIKSLNLDDPITYTQAMIDSRYASEFSDQARDNGPYHGKIVDFLDMKPIYTGYTQVGVRYDGFHGVAPLYYVQLQHIDFVGDKTVESIMGALQQREQDFQERTAAKYLYTTVRKAYEYESIIPELNDQKIKDQMLGEMIGQLRSYGALRIREDQQAREDRIEKWLKDHDIECKLQYKSMMDQTIVHMVEGNDARGTGQNLEEALLNWIEKLIG